MKQLFIIAPRLWNGLPEDLRAAASVDIFKSKLKTFSLALDDILFIGFIIFYPFIYLFESFSLLVYLAYLLYNFSYYIIMFSY